MMPFLIFPNRAAYNAFETKMRRRFGIPKPGRNALTGEIVDPLRLTGRGWTLRYSPQKEAADGRILTVGRDADLDIEDRVRETQLTDQVIADFGLKR